MAISSYLYGNYKNLGKMLTDGSTAINAVLVGDSTSEQSYYPNYDEAICRFWDVNIASRFINGRASGAYGDGGYISFLPNSAKGTNTVLAPGDTYTDPSTWNNNFPTTATGILGSTFALNDSMFNTYDGYTGVSVAKALGQQEFRGWWHGAAMTAKSLFVKNTTGMTNVNLKMGRGSTLTSQSTANDLSGAAALVSLSGTISAQTAASTTGYTVADIQVGATASCNTKYLIYMGSVFGKTTPGAAPFRLTNCSTTGFRTVDHVSTADASGLVPAGAKANGKYTDANLTSFLAETLNTGAYAGSGTVANPPNLIIIHLGLNAYTGTNPDFDGTQYTQAFMDYLEAIVLRYQTIASNLGAASPQFLILTPWANNGTGSTNTKADSSQTYCINLAKKYPNMVTCFDVYGYIKSNMVLQDFDSQYLRSADHLHLTGMGCWYVGTTTWAMVLESSRQAALLTTRSRGCRILRV